MRNLILARAGLAALMLTAAVLHADQRSGQPTDLPQITDPAKAGRELAAELRSSAPTEASEFSGALRVRVRGEWSDGIPATLRLVPGATNWQTIYETRPANGQPATRFVAIHALDRPNDYWLAKAAKPGEALPEAIRITDAQAVTPLAGTDFWLSDLGLDFFHWPGQRVLRYEMRRGRSCRVLESTPPPGAKLGYGRVLSWIDRESNGLLQAEAYDLNNRLLKEFTVRSIKKVDGVWQVKDMDIRTLTNGSLTRLEFELTTK
jgi:hypothetical protein